MFYDSRRGGKNNAKRKNFKCEHPYVETQTQFLKFENPAFNGSVFRKIPNLYVSTPNLEYRRFYSGILKCCSGNTVENPI